MKSWADKAQALPRIYKVGKCWLVTWHRRDGLIHVGSWSLARAGYEFFQALAVHRRLAKRTSARGHKS